MKYRLMHKTIPVLQMDLDEVTGAVAAAGEIFAPDRVPVGIAVKDRRVDRAALHHWWTRRSIPASRSGLHEALEIMHVSSPQSLIPRGYGLSLSDQYWALPEGMHLKWENINFFHNEFSDDVGDILFGKTPGKHPFNLVSPDNTSDGWLQKKWAILDGKRCLIKGGSGATRQEPYNEILASEIMRRLGVPHIPYTLTFIEGYPCSICENFITPETELISAWYIMQTRKRDNRVSLYRHFLDCCSALGIPDIRGALDKMLTVDYLIANEDRHFGNFGAIRNADTLEWIGLAPVFDSGTSLWHDKPTPMIRPLFKSLAKPFCSSHEEQIKLIGGFEWLQFSALESVDASFEAILANAPFLDDFRRRVLCSAPGKRAEMLADHIRSRCVSGNPEEA